MTRARSWLLERSDRRIARVANARVNARWLSICAPTCDAPRWVVNPGRYRHAGSFAARNGLRRRSQHAAGLEGGAHRDSGRSEVGSPL